MKVIHKERVTAACGCKACVNNKDEPIFSIFKDKLVYFCTEKCKKEFDEDPDAFLNSNHFRITLEELDPLKYIEEN